MTAPLCARCQQHPAVYIRRQRRPGRKPLTIVKADDEHTLCPRCYRSQWDSQRAEQIRGQA